MPATNLLDSNSCRSTAYAKDLRGSLRLFSLLECISTPPSIEHFDPPRTHAAIFDRSPGPPLLSFPCALIPSFFSFANYFDPSPLLLPFTSSSCCNYPLPLTASRTKHFLIGFRSERTVRPISFRKGSGCFCRFYRISMWLLSLCFLSFGRLFISSDSP